MSRQCRDQRPARPDKGPMKDRAVLPMGRRLGGAHALVVHFLVRHRTISKEALMRTTTKLGAALLLLLPAAISAPALADEIHLSASLDGNHEVPPVTTDATGSATFTVNDAQTEIAFTLSVVGIDPANITAAHIHFGAPGVAGPILF